MRKISLILFSFVLFFSLYNSVDAAILSFIPELTSAKIGQEFYIDIKIDTEDFFINAAQTTVNFPNDILEAVGVEKDNSIFNFWVSEPLVSNENGIISFVGGTAKGVSGESLQVIRVKFKAVGSGNADISMTESVVTANDGKGTNILSSIVNSLISVGTDIIPASLPEISRETPIVQPERVEREAVSVEDLPGQPILKVPAYDDGMWHGHNGEKWHNHQNEVIVMWEVPIDVIKVAVSVDGLPNSEPMIAEDILFAGKNLGVLDEGINYIHVQFKNNKGWGKVAHYKVAIDMTPPPSFEIGIDSSISDNPTPKINYRAEDSLSGYSHALIIVDGETPVRSDERSFMLSPQKPGNHIVVVKIFDKAGNSVEDDLNFEILPLETPVIDFVTHKIPQDEYAFVSGRSIPSSFVDIRVFNDKDQEIYFGSTNTDISGEWKVVAEELFPRGKYLLSVSARDNRGAISYQSTPEEVNVTNVVVFSLGVVDLGWFEILIILILTVLAIGGFASWYYIGERQRGSAYSIVASRDVVKMSKLLEDNLIEIEGVIKQQKKMQKGLRPQLDSVFKKMRTNIQSMKKYLGKTIGKAK